MKYFWAEIYIGHVKKKVALCDTAKIEKLQIFVLFENEAAYKDFFAHKCFSHVGDTLCNVNSQNLI